MGEEGRGGKGQSGAVIPGPSLRSLARVLLCSEPHRCFGGVHHPGVSWTALLEETVKVIMPSLPAPQLRTPWPQQVTMSLPPSSPASRSPPHHGHRWSSRLRPESIKNEPPFLLG